MDAKTKLRSAFILCWGLFSHVPGACSESTPPANPRYILLETEDAYVYMDEEGVALRADRDWACRNVWWASTADPKIFSSPDFTRFRQGQIDGGTWNQWLCKAVIGPVVFSREILEAQRKLNMAPAKPSCVSWVPETGRLNWEMLDYARCLLTKEVEQARQAYRHRMSSALAEALGDGTTGFDALVAKARLARLPFSLEGCGKPLKTVLEAVACRMEKQDQLLSKAEEYHANYSARIEIRRGKDPISQADASGIAEDGELIRSQLSDAQREADGL
jgi:hypothetical protein